MTDLRLARKWIGGEKNQKAYVLCQFVGGQPFLPVYTFGYDRPTPFMISQVKADMAIRDFDTELEYLNMIMDGWDDFESMVHPGLIEWLEGVERYRLRLCEGMSE